MSQNWRRRRIQDHHTDDWLMTYADMITLLLCFFAIFLSVSVPKKDVVRKIDLPQPTAPVTPPDVLKGDLPFYGLPHLSSPGDDRGSTDQAHAERAESAKDVLTPLTLSGREGERPLADQLPGGDVTTDIKQAHGDAAPPSLIEIIARLKLSDGPAAAMVEKEGQRVTTMQMSSGAFFTVGSATLSEAGKDILRNIAANIKSPAYAGYHAIVEGHTDDSPISTAQFPSNWELSTARAAAVVRYLLEAGVEAERLRAAGYADTFPIAPNHDAAGKPIAENQARNRRVVIKLEKTSQAEDGQLP